MFASVLFLFVGIDVMAIEEATYTVVNKSDKFELRDYAPHVLAKTIMEGSFTMPDIYDNLTADTPDFTIRCNGPI